MCVPGVHMCVCAPSKKRMFAFQLNTFMRVRQANIYIYICVCVCVHGCTSASATCTFQVAYICVFHVCAHACLNWTCVSELPM